MNTDGLALLALLFTTLTPIFAQPPDDLKPNFHEAERRIVRSGGGNNGEKQP
jgi:hypothetical protein